MKCWNGTGSLYGTHTAEIHILGETYASKYLCCLLWRLHTNAETATGWFSCVILRTSLELLLRNRFTTITAKMNFWLRTRDLVQDTGKNITAVEQ